MYRVLIEFMILGLRVVSYILILFLVLWKPIEGLWIVHDLTPPTNVFSKVLKPSIPSYINKIIDQIQNISHLPANSRQKKRQEQDTDNLSFQVIMY